MKTFRVIGVPEHFNLPWQIALEEHQFQEKGIDLEWTSIPEGTGKMAQMLREDQADMAIILTEGILKDISLGNPSKIVQVYVASPLIWGIHVAANSNFKNLSDLEHKKVAISRVGSGSQLMALVNAKNQGWDATQLEFEIVNTIDGAVISLTEGTADYFMWERFMTQPLVDSGIFRRIADCPTPWPCFVIAVRNEILEQFPNQIQEILKTINSVTSSFKSIPNIESRLASTFNQTETAISEWISLTEWSSENLDETQFNHIQNQLLEFGIIDKKGTFVDVVKSL